MRTARTTFTTSHKPRKVERQARIAIALQSAEQQNERRLRRMGLILMAATLLLIVNAVVVMNLS
jgi:hypothetical protein